MQGLYYSHSREYRKIFLRDHFPHISQILDGLHIGANTCHTCIRTRTNTGDNSWRIIYVLVLCQGAFAHSFVLGPDFGSQCTHVKYSKHQ